MSIKSGKPLQNGNKSEANMHFQSKKKTKIALQN